jgi:Flp pilus assembly protein TadG
MVRGLARARDESGTATLELAVVLPLLFTLALGVFEFGNLIYRYHLITVGVRDAARYLSGVQANATTEAAAKNIATRGTTDTSGTVRVSGTPAWLPADVVVTYSSVANADAFGNKIYRGGATIPLVTVSTSYAYQPLGFMGYLGLGTITLTASHQERVFGSR